MHDRRCCCCCCRYRIGLKSRRRGWPAPGCVGQRVHVRGMGPGILRYYGALRSEHTAQPLKTAKPAKRGASKPKAAAAPSASDEAVPLVSPGTEKPQSSHGKDSGVAVDDTAFVKVEEVDAADSTIIGVSLDAPLGDSDGV